jgi:hypothetical protein
MPVIFRGIEPGAANFRLGLPDLEEVSANLEFELETLVKRRGGAKMGKSVENPDGYEFAPRPGTSSGDHFSKINTNWAPSLVLSKYCTDRRNIMRRALRRFGFRALILTIALAAGVAALATGPAHARALPGAATLWLSCENGGTYRIQPIAISDEGDLVTAHLIRRGGRGAHVRLIPSGEGYRYAGRGIWFDGWRESVYLYLSKYRPIACTVVGEPERPRG